MDDLNAWWALEGLQIVSEAKTMERQKNATMKGFSSCDEGRREDS